jgi:lipopolysaccharide export system permease protein
MKSLSIFIVLLAVLSFFFANSVIPLAEFNFFNLRRNIAKVKPAMAIAEGQFNQLNDINIKVSEKSGDNGQYLKDVIIHQKKGSVTGNYTVIKSNTGEFISDESSNVLQLVLIDGNYYDEIQPADYTKRTKNKPQVKSTFEKYIINIDLSKFNDIDFESQDKVTKHTMLNVIDLNTALDSLNKSRDLLFTNFTKTMLQRSNQPSLNQNYKITEKDSLSSDLNILKLFNDQKAIQLINISQNSVKTAKKDLKVKIKRMLLSQVNINKHIVALHDKFALGLSCIILFFVGAPLGALIRKGGIGLPLVIAILIFLTYHFISIFAKNSSEDSSMDPVLASWLSSLILLPFSVYLTNRATKDRALIDVDSILIPLKTLVISSNDSELSGSLPTPADKISELKEYENTQLIGIIKEYRNLGHSLKYRNSALQTLNQRGVSELELKMGGYLTNPTYENALRLYIDFKENSKLALVFYLLTLFTGLIGYVLNNIGFDTLGSLLVGIAIVSIVFYLIVMQKSVINQSQFYKIISVNFFKKSFILILLGLPLFYFYRSFFTSKMEEELLKIT